MPGEITEYPKCVGCGYCCKKGQCSLSVYVFGEQSICPVLRYHTGRYWCGLVEVSRILEKHDEIIKELHIGAGCCCSMNTDRRKYL